MSKNVVVIGTQWGDEGKGKIVDWLTDHAEGVVRFQGGHNAGHTLVVNGKKTVLRLIPSGTHEYAGFIRPQELVSMAEHAGLQAVALCGMDYHPLARRAVLSRNLDINYLLATRKAAS